VTSRDNLEALEAGLVEDEDIQDPWGPEDPAKTLWRPVNYQNLPKIPPFPKGTAEEAIPIPRTMTPTRPMQAQVMAPLIRECRTANSHVIPRKVAK
jgi:hypothetical protein